MTILNNEITTPRQAKNGTRAFKCNRTGYTYTSYSSGYVRRQRAKYYTPTVLNKREKQNVCYNMFGKQIFANVLGCIMIDTEDERLALIEKRSQTFTPKHLKWN